jgi:hypothetical protein
MISTDKSRLQTTEVWFLGSAIGIRRQD